MGSASVPLDRALLLLSSYRLSIVIIALSATVWPQFAMYIFTEAFDPQLWRLRHISVGDESPTEKLGVKKNDEN